MKWLILVMALVGCEVPAESRHKETKTDWNAAVKYAADCRKLCESTGLEISSLSFSDAYSPHPHCECRKPWKF